MEINYYLNNIEYGEAVLLLGAKYNKSILIKGDKVKHFLLQVANENRIFKVIKMLGIDATVLDYSPDNLSNIDATLIVMAYQLLQGKELVFNYLDVLLNHKEENFIKSILIKLVHDYHIKLAIFTNNISFCFGLIDRIIIVKNKEIIKYLSNDFYNMEIYKYIDMPEIIRFVLTSQSLGKKLDNYLELSELLKGLYRL